MKYLYCSILFLLLAAIPMFGQQDTKLVAGTVSYLSSQNVYVKFKSTEGIEVGDTLFLKKGEVLIPAMLVSNKSSSSCVNTPIVEQKFEVKDELYAKVAIAGKEKNEEEKEGKQEERPSAKPLVTVVEDQGEEEAGKSEFKQKIKGRISAASYSTMSSGENAQTLHRMRYAFNLTGSNINNSRFSTENYITFRHTLGEWQEVQDNLADALKVYTLAVKYDLDKRSNITLGRKINYKISSMGAIDGLQVEKGLGREFLVGALAGTRPDFADYGFNANLLQVGAFVGHYSAPDKKFQQTTLAFVEQRNRSSTDRRFTYFQHSNNLAKNMTLFTSFEVDLYEKMNGAVHNKLSLTNLYASIRYRFSKKLNASLSYDNRKNIIFYESYKNFIDQLVDDETRQGLRLNASYRLLKLVTWGANLSWRFQKSDMNLSKNLNTYVNISRLPFIKAQLSLSANFLQTNYIDSKVFGIRMSKDFMKGKLNGDLYFRYGEYHYKANENTNRQEIIGASLSYRLMKKLSLYLYYEGTFDNIGYDYNRLNTKLIQRF